MQFFAPVRLPSAIVIKGDRSLAITGFALLNLYVPFADPLPRAFAAARIRRCSGCCLRPERTSSRKRVPAR